ncbi:MAG: LptA/OstA family protein [Vulcanimicrobiota bacterium]
MKKYLPIILILLLLNLNPSIYAQNRNKVKLRADKLIYSQDRNRVTLTGGVRFDYEETALTGSSAYYNLKTQAGQLEGNVHFFQPGMEVFADKMLVYYKANTVKLTGNVKILSSEAPFTTSGASGDITEMYASTLEYNWENRQGEATGNIKVVQGNQRAFADKAIYNGYTQVIELTGNVKMEQGSNNWLYSEKALVDMRQEIFMATGGVQGTFWVEEATQGEGQATFHMGDYPDKLITTPPSYKIKMIP